jgi:hypothetical protein
MPKYTHIEYTAGCVKEVINYIAKGDRKGIPGAEKPRKKTREQMQDANMRQAARHLARKLNANFRPGDWHVTLTYSGKVPPTPEEARRCLDEFIKELKKRYRKAGHVFKWVVVTEYKRTKRIHHHLIISDINAGEKETTARMVRELWSRHGSPKFVALYDNGEYSKLADYLIKETDRTFRESREKGKQRYRCSRNLTDPKPETTPREVKGMQRAGVSPVPTPWKQEPKTRPGYYIIPDSLCNGIDKMGYPYQRYTMVKLNPTDEDWPDTKLAPAHEKGRRKRGRNLKSSSKRNTTGTMKN